MRNQIAAILWAQYRVTRNRFGKTSVGAVVFNVITGLWYLSFAGLGVLAAVYIPSISAETLYHALPIALLVVFVYSQTVPLLTLSTGWSLQLKKIQVYPIRESALFSLEVLLRLTGIPEVLLVIAGGVIGLLRRPDIPAIAALGLLLFIPFNLFLLLAVREFFLHAFSRNRFREIFAVILLSIGLLPQFLLRTSIGAKLKPYFLSFADGLATPWHAAAALSLNRSPWMNLLILASWTELAFMLARHEFTKGLLDDGAVRSAPRAARAAQERGGHVLDSLANWFQDPVAAIVQKELRSLVRMPRFRVTIGMACLFSVVFLASGAFGGHSFFGRFGVANLYAILLVSDMLLLNVFGADRGAVQFYFVSPVSLEQVIKAKNIAAALFILAVDFLIAVLSYALARGSVIAAAAGFVAAIVAAINLMWAGNLLSVMAPRPIDPNSTTRRAGSSARSQLWILACTAGMAALVGLAYLAQWAFNSPWALFGVLVFEFAVGFIVYLVSMESAVAQGIARRESIVTTLSASASPIASGNG